jgi:N-acetylglucosamine-6-phosphate deacetylase
VIEGSKILDVVRSPRFAELPAERHEVQGFICPGFIDLQINGALGKDVGTEARALEGLGRELPKTGVTSFLPTAISWPAESYADFVDAIREASNSPGATILGAHIEGRSCRPHARAPTIRPIFGRWIWNSRRGPPALARFA